MICVECGAEAPRLIGGSCPTCFVGKTKLLEAPDVLDVQLCAHCDARQVGAHWLDPVGDEDLGAIRENAVRDAVRPHRLVQAPALSFEEAAQDERNFLVTVHLEGAVEGAAVNAESRVTVRMRRGVCDRCSRMFGGFYASMLQLRATGRDLTPKELERAHRLVGEDLDRLRAGGNRNAFLAKSEPVPGGFDYYLGEIEAGRIVSRTLADRLGAQVTESAKIVGRKLGVDIFRVTFLVRIRLFAPGDFATYGERVVEVMNLARGRAQAIDLATHQTTKMEEDELRRLGGAELLREAVLVSRTPSGIQVMDPVDFRTVDLVPPPGWAPEGEMVWVLRHEERLYIPRTTPPPSPPPKSPKRLK